MAERLRGMDERLQGRVPIGETDYLIEDFKRYALYALCGRVFIGIAILSAVRIRRCSTSAPLRPAARRVVDIEP
jgi:hypothetical protein